VSDGLGSVMDRQSDDAEARSRFFDTCLLILLGVALFTAVVGFLATA
jgi:hypothetical protein